VPDAGDQPGWKPDPERPGMLRWWNGLGWSDARKTPDGSTDRALAAAREAVQSSTVTPQQVARTTATKKLEQTVPTAAKAAGASLNPFATGAVATGIFGFIFGFWGVVSAIGLIVSIRGLIRSRRLAAKGTSRTGFAQSLAGLVINVIGLIRWAPLLSEIPDQITWFLNG
jgi:hypothetical protein